MKCPESQAMPRTKKKHIDLDHAPRYALAARREGSDEVTVAVTFSQKTWAPVWR
jgi:hypothetical protein